MAPLSCLAGPDKQSRSKTDVRSALDTLSALDAIFSDSGYESGSVGDDEDDDDGQLPPEHYLALAESLDIAQLRQKRYSPRTQEKLDETRGYWERYCRHIKANAERQWDRISNSKKTETASRLSKDTIVKIENVVVQMTTEKELALVEWSKKNMYIEDVVEFAQVVLIITEMTFLAAIIVSHLSAILHLQYQDIVLTLIRVPDSGRPRLFIFLKPEFTKRFLGDKAPNEFKILEIIFDSTLVLSLHICLLTMLFHIEEFKSISTSEPVLDCAEKLYSVKMLNDKRQQPLLLKNELLNKFVFCQTEPTFTGFKICLDQRMTSSMVSSRMRRAGEITGFEKVAHPYNLRYAGAKAFNNSKKVTEALQNIMLQHADIRTFVKHYQVDVDVDAQGINLKHYKNEQPVIDLERQLAGKLVNIKVMDTFEHEVFMSLEHLMFVDCVLTMPGANLEAEYQQRINTINTGVAFCGVEEERPSRRPTQTRGRPAVDDDPCPPTKRQRCLVKNNTEILLHQAMKSVQAKSTAEQPQTCFQSRVCFLCVENPSCALKDRIMKYTTVRSLTRHFLRRHINPSWPATEVECNVCEGKVLPVKSALLSHAEKAHGTVVRGRAREKLALEYQRSLEN
ncbi:hypothetical protein AJ78_06036 [Emergomyces pasteurianus Ep9510]|uniref:Uncharacterized protein n=1 Tax=Emergomyces pasteurianus Ep9510 TaxID=1447872 RepID=A0A1J9PAI5_9EURO|nr:hypothetical protein AJ78_06036 [Emergomyces pasteurianus Ep9510]